MKTPDKIIKIVADYYYITVDELKERTRKNEIKEARFVAAYLIRKYTYMPFAKIGATLSSSIPFGHDTIINAVNKVNNWQDYDKMFKEKLNDIDSLINGPKEDSSEIMFQENDFFAPEMPFENKFKDLVPVNGNGYSGFREHQL